MSIQLNRNPEPIASLPHTHDAATDTWLPVAAVTPAAIANAFKAVDAVDVEPTGDLWVPAAGTSVLLTGGRIAGTVTGNYKFTDGTTVLAVFPLTANTPFDIAALGEGLNFGEDNTVTCVGPSASVLSGTLYGRIV